MFVHATGGNYLVKGSFCSHVSSKNEQCFILILPRPFTEPCQNISSLLALGSKWKFWKSKAFWLMCSIYHVKIVWCRHDRNHNTGDSCFISILMGYKIIDSCLTTMVSCYNVGNCTLIVEQQIIGPAFAGLPDLKLSMPMIKARVLRCLQQKLACAIDKWLRVISNTMLFKTVIPLII